MAIDPSVYLDHGIIGAICLVLAIIVGAGLTIINGISRDGNRRDERLLTVLEKNGLAMSVVGERLAALQTRLDNIEDKCMGNTKDGGRG